MHSRVPDGTLAHRPSCHGTVRTPSSCTVLCKVSSLTGRWLIDGFLMALRGFCPLEPCYARSRSCRDAGLLVVLSRHCENFVLLYRVMQGRVPVGTRVRLWYQAMFIPHYEQSGIVYQVTRLGEVLSHNAVPMFGKNTRNSAPSLVQHCQVAFLRKRAVMSIKLPSGCRFSMCWLQWDDFRGPRWAI